MMLWNGVQRQCGFRPERLVWKSQRHEFIVNVASFNRPVGFDRELFAGRASFADPHLQFLEFGATTLPVVPRGLVVLGRY